MPKRFLIGFGAAIGFASAALADASGIATGNLNVRTGPGTGYPVVDVIPRNGAVTVHGCLAGGNWCAVNHAGTAGWSHAGWLTTASARPVSSAFGVRMYAATDLRRMNPATVTRTATVNSTRPLAARMPMIPTGRYYIPGWGYY
jgi:hypothetical protein